ncbi:MAG TPA: sigma-70 family RNA polymerase sigma factor [Oligoflexus sp.]|uniref:RNA polymerase sigma factor n=1 Tax=Oligoflexus sp. TaxID=1971216 RepID=UPI002D51BB38|nr:sigma-70 family RNA polymerase sigma factor [Oligoflexus sp.]HYX33171.1 sigma-70 family RNA polymerase sigma factor [Oligoflexus sp.]
MNTSMRFEDIYYSNIQIVRKIISGYRISNGQADDIAQQTFLQAFEKLSTVRDTQSIKGWISTITRNNCMNMFRSKEFTRLDPLDGDHNDDRDHYELGFWFDPESGEADLELEQNLVLLRRLLETYKKVPRGVIARLYYMEGQTTREIAEQMKMSQNTVLSHLLLFRREMKAALVLMQQEH